MERLKGIAYVAISAFLFGCMPLLAKNIYLLGGNAVTLVFHRFSLALPILFILIRKDFCAITKEEFIKVTILSFGLAGTPVLLYISYNYIASGTATAIHFMYPILVVLAYVIFFRQKISMVKVICIVLSTTGILLFYTNDKSNVIGILIAFASAISFTFYIIYLDRSGLKTMPSLKLTFYLSAVSSVELFLFSSVTKTLTFNIKPLGWILTFVLVIFISIIATVLFQIGVKIIGPQRTAILSTLEPITSIVIGVIAFNEAFNIKIGMGMFFIILSVVLLTIFDKDSDTQKPVGEYHSLEASFED